MKKCMVQELESILSAGNKTAQIVDVREPAEFASEHIEGSNNLPLSSFSKKTMETLDRTKPVYILCQSGGRACRAAEQLEQAGHKSVYVVEGGVQAWISAGKKITKGEIQIWSLDRQIRFTAGFLVLSGLMLNRLVHPYWIALSVFVALGLIFSAITNTCGMAFILSKMPWNQIKLRTEK